MVPILPVKYLNLIPRPGFGVRLPQIVIPAIMKVLKEFNVVADIMLSYNRETAPEDVIKSLRPEDFLRGHTGTSIREYITLAIEYSNIYSTIIEVEADHISLMASPERAIKRISVGGFEYGLTEDEIKSSIDYIRKELEEARSVGGVRFVTLDTCELIDLGVDRLSDKDVEARYESELDSDMRKTLEKEYLNRRFTFIHKNRIVEVKINEKELRRLALKYLKSIEYIAKLYDIVREYLGEVGFEVALDEVPQVTNPKDLLFYLNELRRRGLKPDFIAPNIGFRKREDYEGSLDELRRRLETLTAVAKSFGCLLSIHSGSGAHPYSDKGLGVWETVRKATEGMVKYKMSGVFIQLLLEVMYSFPEGSKVRILYDEIFDEVYDYIKKEIERKGLLYSKELEKLIMQYEVEVKKGVRVRRDPRADFFRHYFFLFQTIRDDRGVRYLRERVLQLYQESEDLRRRYERELYELLRRFIVKLGYVNNAVRWSIEYM